MKKLILMLMLCAPMTMMAQKFGKVNTQQIMQSLPDVAKANGEMEALQQQKETELQTLQQKIQQAYQDGQQELQKKSSELMQPIVAKVRTAIAAVGKAGNYTFIFEDGAAVYTGTNVVDVTKEVQAKIK